jgi:hypothetical protein
MRWRVRRSSARPSTRITGADGNGDRRPFVREAVPDAVRRTVENLNLPAYVTAAMDVLAWNRAADELRASAACRRRDRAPISVLTNPATRPLFGAGWVTRLGAWWLPRHP